MSIDGEPWLEDIEVNLPWPWLDRKLETNLHALGELPPDVAMRRAGNAMIEELPKVMFLLLPVFALLLEAIYARRRRFYIEHFVFALHVHAFAFILFLLVLGFTYLILLMFGALAAAIMAVAVTAPV